MNGHMVIGQMCEQYVMKDLAYKVLDSCWDACFDSQLSAKELIAGDIDEDKLRKMDHCKKRCLNRHFEVMKLLNEEREKRDKEAMGLAPPS